MIGPNQENLEVPIDSFHKMSLVPGKIEIQVYQKTVKCYFLESAKR